MGDFADANLLGLLLRRQLECLNLLGTDLTRVCSLKKRTEYTPLKKPVKLYEWLLTNYAKEGDKILDTHFGSGSHGIACGNLGFSIDAWELDPDYFHAAHKRIESHFSQLNAFQTKPIINTFI
jgi:DNA modification methylase